MNEQCIFRSTLIAYDMYVKAGNSLLPPATDHTRRPEIVVLDTYVHEIGSPAAHRNITTILCDKRSKFSDPSIGMQRFTLDFTLHSSIDILSSPDPRRTVEDAPDSRDEQVQVTLDRLRHAVREVPTKQTLQFGHLTDLHAFQYAIGGYPVTYDGICNWFPSRRRAAFPLSRAGKAIPARVQILSGRGRTRLLAFLAGGRAYSLDLKAWDAFEPVDSKEGWVGVRLVGARPATSDDRNEFLTLSLTEITEHLEDCVLGFANVAARDLFAAALPAALAPPKGFSLIRRT